VLGIVALVCCGVFTGIPAIVMGNNAKKEIEASGGTIGGDGKIQAGVICGWVSVAFGIVAVLYWLVVLGANA
jgi:hypothetical protein